MMRTVCGARRLLFNLKVNTDVCNWLILGTLSMCNFLSSGELCSNLRLPQIIITIPFLLSLLIEVVAQNTKHANCIKQATVLTNEIHYKRLLFSERELTFTFAICCCPSVCPSFVVCRL